MSQREQAVSLTKHRAHDQHDLVALPLTLQRELGHVSHPIQVADRRTTEFLNDESHGVSPGSPHDRGSQGREAVILSRAGCRRLRTMWWKRSSRCWRSWPC